MSAPQEENSVQTCTDKDRLHAALLEISRMHSETPIAVAINVADRALAGIR